MDIPYYEDETPEQEAAWRELAVAWKARFGNTEVTALQVAEMANPIGALPVKRDAQGIISVRSLGRALVETPELADGIECSRRRVHKGSVYRLAQMSRVDEVCQHRSVRCIDCGAVLPGLKAGVLH